MAWYYNGVLIEDIPEKAVGFVYIITHKPTNKYYIGKKSFFFRKTKQVKGRKKKTLVESDWKKYYGSSVEVQELVASVGEDEFHREILRFCYTKAELSYFEAKYQFDRDALLDDNSFNSWISVRVRRAHLRSISIAQE